MTSTTAQTPPDKTDDVLIIGAGPAGLTAGYKLTQEGSQSVRILESNPTYVGGISRTEKYKGYSLDVGGHRFFSKSEEIEALWKEIMPQDFLLRPRLSRIFYQNKFYSYPLKAFEALANLGVIESGLCALSYLCARLFPIKHPKSFADWVSNQFGSRLFRIFFKTYTEKVWGIGCDELSADWAAQRIKGLNLLQAVLASLRSSLGGKASNNRGQTIKTLTEEFYYPRLGPGMMWEKAAQKIKDRGGIIEMGWAASALDWNETDKLWRISATNPEGQTRLFQARHVISSAPMRDLVSAITPKPCTEILAKNLKYRDFFTVALILNRPVPFNDNWIYIHDPSVRVGRIQNFAAWSPALLASPDTACLGFEYFCFDTDAIWKKPDAELISMATAELKKLGIADAGTVIDGCVVRQEKTYPVYDDAYANIVNAVRDEFETRFPTLHFVGRNGMHKYDNQDHAMMTAILTVKNILAGKKLYDVWSVNEDAAYHEERDAKAISAMNP